MNLLFSDPPSGKTDVKDTTFQEYYPQISRSINWDYLKPHLTNASRQFIIPLIGADLYDDMVSPSGTIATELADYLRFALANYAIFLAAPGHNLAFGDAGIFSHMTDKTAPSSQWAFMQLRWNAIYQADKNMGLAMDFIIKNIDDAAVSSFKDSAEHNKLKNTFFTGPEQFKEYAQVDSFKTYLALRPYILKSEKVLEDTIGLDQITATIAEGSPSDAQTKFIELARRYIADQSLLLALPNLAIYAAGSAVMVISSIDGLDGRVGVFSKDNKEAMATLMDQLQAQAGENLQKLKDLLFTEPDDFSIWKDKNYVEGKTSSIVSGTSGVFI